MKCTLIALCFATVLGVTTATTPPTVVPTTTPLDSAHDTRRIQGLWKGYQPKIRDSIAFIFYTKNRGRSFVKQQSASKFHYKIDFSKKPIQLDMLQDEGMSFAIIRLWGSDTMQLKLDPDGRRPIGFEKGYDSSACILIRVPMPGQDSVFNK